VLLRILLAPPGFALFFSFGGCADIAQLEPADDVRSEKPTGSQPRETGGTSSSGGQGGQNSDLHCRANSDCSTQICCYKSGQSSCGQSGISVCGDVLCRLSANDCSPLSQLRCQPMENPPESGVGHCVP
jgi:hypothetical protein